MHLLKTCYLNFVTMNVFSSWKKMKKAFGLNNMLGLIGCTGAFRIADVHQ